MPPTQDSRCLNHESGGQDAVLRRKSLSTQSIILIDGEHYPPVTERAITALKERGEQPVLALLVGGSEKLGQVDLDVGVPVELAAENTEAKLAAAIERTGVTQVIDLSDEPVLGYVRRCRLASVALWKGASYEGADFSFRPPPRPRLAKVPSVAIIGTGKRVGKTAIGATTSRVYEAAGLRPVVVAMGRGGPAEPQVIRSAANLTPEVLLSWVEAGKHAASDYIQDAMMAGVPTVGSWRAAGGMAGATGFSNYPKAIEAAHGLDPGLLIFEGSGAAQPPAHFDAAILVVHAKTDPAHVYGYFGLHRVLLSDLVILAMCERDVPESQLMELEAAIRSGPKEPPAILRTVLRPRPLADVRGKRIFFATTASSQAGGVIKEYFESRLGATVLGMSHALANRPKLREHLAEMPPVDAVCVELKAAAVDVVTRFAVDRGLELIYVDNHPVPIDGDPEHVHSGLLAVAHLARDRFEAAR